MVETKKVEWLAWRGYSTDKRIDLSGWTEGFSYPAASFRKIPFCAESYNLLNTLDFQSRVDRQKKLFDSVDHSAMACIYIGVMKSAEFKWMQEQITKCSKAMLKLVQLATVDDINGTALKELMQALPPDRAQYLKSALSTSLYFYANQNVSKPFAQILDKPLYLEQGVDLLTNGTKMMLSEYQVRYMTPFPHLLTELSSAYASVMPELFRKFVLTQESFEDRRNAQLQAAFDKFLSQSKEKKELSRVVVDAWCYKQNNNATLKKTATSLNADYVLFDDFNRDQNIHEKNYRDKLLAVINQAPLNLLDPSNGIFEKLNLERLEFYDELAWTDLLNRYLAGNVFLANPPITDLINDKALSSVIPDIYKAIYGEELQLPVVSALPCWSIDDPTKPEELILEEAKASKDNYVIAHRYLEGGMGIRVGRATDQEEWDNFVDTFIVDRPYLYVLREHFEMEPDMSLRLLCSTTMPNVLADVDQAKFEISDTAYARFTTTSPLTSENHRSFLVFPAAASAPEPAYTVNQAKEESSGR